MYKLMNLYVDTNCNTKRTAIAYTRDIKKMIDFIQKDVTDITTADLVEWKNSMSDLSTATVARRLGSVKRFFEFLYNEDYIEKNVAKSLRLPKVVNTKETTLTKEQVEALIANGKNP